MGLSVHHGDNRALHAALASAPPRSVVVCDAGGDAEHGYFGELMARNALAGGIAGLVIDGAIRDSTAIASITFPCLFPGRMPRAPLNKEVEKLRGKLPKGTQVAVSNVADVARDLSSVSARFRYLWALVPRRWIVVLGISVALSVVVLGVVGLVGGTHAVLGIGLALAGTAATVAQYAGAIRPHVQSLRDAADIAATAAQSISERQAEERAPGSDVTSGTRSAKRGRSRVSPGPGGGGAQGRGGGSRT